MKGVYIILIVLGALFLASTVTFLTIAIVNYTRSRASINKMLNNTLFCDQGICPWNPTNYPLPSVTPGKFDPKVARWGMELIGRLEYKSAGGVLVPPGAQLTGIFYDDANSKPFASIAVDSNEVSWLSIRGTMTDFEWLQDFTYNQIDNPYGAGKIHKGFNDAYTKFRTDVRKALSTSTVVISGHSLGAAVATLAAQDFAANGKKVILYTFGSPRVGNIDFAKNFGVEYYRIANTCDIVPTVPFSVMPDFRNPDEPWIFQHTGTLVSFTANWKSLYNAHFLPVVFELLNQLIAGSA